MPFKWNDTTERMLLLQFLDQNSGLKLDSDAALASWPSDDLGQTTKRAITDRFNLLKKKLNNATIPASNGLTSTLSPVTYIGTAQQAVPATPSANPNKKANSQQVGGARSQVKASPNPISTATGSSKTTFTNRLRGKPQHAAQSQSGLRKGVTSARSVAHTQNKGKATKRKPDDDDTESSMVSEESESSRNESGDDALDGSPSTGRRSLPRRSKSVTTTPGGYRDDSSSYDSHDTEDDGSADGEEGAGNGDAQAGARYHENSAVLASGKKKKIVNDDNAENSDTEDEDNDSTFDIHKNRNTHKRSRHSSEEDGDSDDVAGRATKKHKPTWRDRIDRVEREMKTDVAEQSEAEVKVEFDEDNFYMDGGMELGTQA